MVGQLTVGGPPLRAVATRRTSYTLRWWSKIRVPRLHRDAAGEPSIQFDLCWAQTSLHGITEDEAGMLRLLLGRANHRGHWNVEDMSNNWLLQRIMAGVDGDVYGVMLTPDTPEQAVQRQPMRAMTRDGATGAEHYEGAVGMHLGPGVHPYDLGI